MAWKVKKHLQGCSKPDKIRGHLLFDVEIRDGSCLTLNPEENSTHTRGLEDDEFLGCAECDAEAYWEDDPEPVESDEDIDVIASGYEWTCPGCGDLRKEIEIKPRFVCKKCNLSYAVSDYKHSVE